MRMIAIQGENSGEAAGMLTKMLCGAGYRAESGSSLESMDFTSVKDYYIYPSLSDDSWPDILFLLPDFGRVHPVHCHMAVFPGYAAPIAELPSADFLITYGMSGRDTVTCSSVAEGRLSLSIQREIRAVNEIRFPEQEIQLVMNMSIEPLTNIAFAACLMAAGAWPNVGQLTVDS